MEALILGGTVEVIKSSIEPLFIKTGPIKRQIGLQVTTVVEVKMSIGSLQITPLQMQKTIRLTPDEFAALKKLQQQII